MIKWDPIKDQCYLGEKLPLAINLLFKGVEMTKEGCRLLRFFVILDLWCVDLFTDLLFHNPLFRAVRSAEYALRVSLGPMTEHLEDDGEMLQIVDEGRVGDRFKLLQEQGNCTVQEMLSYVFIFGTVPEHNCSAGYGIRTGLSPSPVPWKRPRHDDAESFIMAKIKNQ